MTPDTLRVWLCICSLTRSFKKITTLLSRVTFAEIPRLSEAEWRECGIDYHPIPWALIDRHIDAVTTHRVTVLSMQHTAYPFLLKQIPDPPLLLFIVGDVTLLSAFQIAMVGSRAASCAGMETADFFARQLVSHHVVVTSGLAEGIDAASHRGALHAGGKTIAVMGTGHAHCYPKHHAALYESIVAKGCVVSEFPPLTPPRAVNFPIRNRIISGLSRGVLVVEASVRSGSLITARQAGSQGREVFAVPGGIAHQKSKGCHVLIQQGAKLVQSVEDVLNEFSDHDFLTVKTRVKPPAIPVLDERSQSVLSCIDEAPTSVDVICHRCGLGSHAVLAALLSLEVTGVINKEPGGYSKR